MWALNSFEQNNDYRKLSKRPGVMYSLLCRLLLSIEAKFKKCELQIFIPYFTFPNFTAK